MKQVLLVSYDWPPKGSVGMIRMVKFAKYLTRSGYGVSVITMENSPRGTVSWDIDEPELEKVSVHRVAPPGEISFFDNLRNRIHPQLEVEWYRAVEKVLDDLMSRIGCDVVISSSPPESSHLIAALIKRRFGKMWIADLRDLWSDDHYRSLGPVRRMLISKAEKDTLKNADRILTVSESWVGLLEKRYGKRVKFIPNGYDEEYFDRIPLEVPGKFTISYLGKLNAGHQDISAFMAAIEEIVDRGSIPREKFEANFYISGYGKPDIAALASKRGLSDVIRESGPVSLYNALKIMKNSSLLLVVGWSGLSAAGWRPQKIYEYMGSGTRVLLVNGSENKELVKVISETGIGRMANDKELIREEILRIYSDFMGRRYDNGGRDSGRLKEYSVSCITRQLCQLIG